MRPTEHRVPLTGAFFIDAVRKFRIMSVTGPMARSVEDLRLALQIITGPDGHDIDVPPVPWREVARPDLRTIRIAWTPSFPEMLIDSEIHAAIVELARELDQVGAQIEQCLPEVNFAEQDQLAKNLFGTEVWPGRCLLYFFKLLTLNKAQHKTLIRIDKQIREINRAGSVHFGGHSDGGAGADVA